MGQRQADEAAAGVGIGVRRPLAGKIRQEEQPLAARPARLGPRRSAGRRLRVLARLAAAASAWHSALRNHCSEPPAERFTPIMCHLPRTAWQKVWTRP